MNGRLKVLAMALLLVAPGVANAAPITGVGTLGSFTGTFDYNPGTATLDISLTNTSPLANGGYITALAFNNPDDLITGVVLVSSDGDFGEIGGAGLDDYQNDIMVSPFGFADIGASITGDWLGGGSPVTGIAVGSTVTFSFTFTGSGVGALTTADFMNTFMTGGPPDWLLVRFRGFEDGGSDKVSAVGFPVVPVPEPSSLTLLGGGIAMMIARRRRAR
jgi:hypothetical protein